MYVSDGDNVETHLVTLSNDGYAQEIDCVHVESDGNDVETERRIGDRGEGRGSIHGWRNAMLTSALPLQKKSKSIYSMVARGS